MNQQFLKVTFHLDTKRINAYLKMPSPTYHVMTKEIEMCLFEERRLPRCDFRTFWIDEDYDEIEIVNQCDYEVFMTKTSGHQHLQVAPVDTDPDALAATADTKTKETSSNSASYKTQVPPAAGSYDFAVHDRVECDACLMSPIVGFRYKCIQCPNYDLCQNCEAKHLHSEHMMLRMPTNNCPNVVESYVTGRTTGRRHGKRSKTSCPFVKNGLSVVIDDDAEAGNSAGGENAEQSSKERHFGRRHHRRQNRNNFFSHLYEMMHDLAEGGGASAAAHAMGESPTASKSGQKTTNPTGGSENEENPIAAAAASAATAATTAAAAHFTSQEVHEVASKVYEMAAEITAQVIDKAGLKSAKNNSEDVTASSSFAAAEAEKGKETSNEKMDAATTTRGTEPNPNTVPVVNTPSLETLSQFLDPQYMRTGIQILNNFSDMFSKMLDPMENTETVENQMPTNLEKDSLTSNKSSSLSSNLNRLGSEKSDKSSVQEKPEEKQTGNGLAPNVTIDDVGTDSENESLSESFVKLNAPENNENQSTHSSKPTTSASSAKTTPSSSLDNSMILDFAQLSADLKAHIAQEAAKDSIKSNEEKSTDSAAKPSATANECVDTTVSNTPAPKKPEEKRAVPIYHVDQRINNAVLVMMGMGFSNEGAWLTQLLESVNGNIPEALDLMSAAQLGGGR